MSFQSSDFLPVWRNGEAYKATTFELQEYLQTGLDFAVSDHNHDDVYLKRTSDRFTGTLTLAGDRAIDLNVDVASGKIGNLKYNGGARVGWGHSQIFLSGEVVIQNANTTGTGGIKMNSKKIYGLADPVNDQDAATKKYVDDNAGGTIQTASASVLGGVKIGSGVSIASDGKISVSTNYASSSHTHSGYASSSHTHSGYASSNHNHNSAYVKGNYTITRSNGIFYIS